MHTQQPIDQAFVAEVTRVLDVGKGDFQRVFELEPGDFWDMKVIENRYRNIMRKLHPDKRREVDMAAVGGEAVCDQAVDIVQHSLDQAKIELPIRQVHEEAQERAKRMQEIALAQARQARYRGEQDVQEAEQRRDAVAGSLLQNVEKAELIGNIKQVLGGKRGSQAKASSAAPVKTPRLDPRLDTSAAPGTAASTAGF